MIKNIVSYYDRDGNPIDVLIWGKLFEDMDYKIIALTEIGPYEISTVWVGLDRNWLSDKLAIFETIIFCKDEQDKLHHYEETYATKEEALEGHQLIIEMTKVQIRLNQSLQENGSGTPAGGK